MMISAVLTGVLCALQNEYLLKWYAVYENWNLLLDKDVNIKRTKILTKISPGKKEKVILFSWRSFL